MRHVAHVNESCRKYEAPNIKSSVSCTEKLRIKRKQIAFFFPLSGASRCKTLQHIATLLAVDKILTLQQACLEKYGEDVWKFVDKHKIRKSLNA